MIEYKPATRRRAGSLSFLEEKLTTLQVILEPLFSGVPVTLSVLVRTFGSETLGTVTISSLNPRFRKLESMVTPFTAKKMISPLAVQDTLTVELTPTLTESGKAIISTQ